MDWGGGGGGGGGGLRVLRPVAMEVYRDLLCLRKILQKPTDSVPQQDCEYEKLKSGCEN